MQLFIATVSTRTLHFVCPKVVGIVAAMALPTVTIFTKRSCLLCFGLGKYTSGLYLVWSQIGSSISGSKFISTISSSGSFMFAKISYNSVASESPSSNSSSSTSIMYSPVSDVVSNTLTVGAFLPLPFLS